MAQVERIEATLSAAQAQGARIGFGGQRAEATSDHYFQPTLVLADGPDTETTNVEMFGPVMTLIPFETEEEAIVLTNDSDFGLGSGSLPRTWRGRIAYRGASGQG